jgi:hypothetical protein
MTKIDERTAANMDVVLEQVAESCLMAVTMKDESALRKNFCKAQRREMLLWTVCAM